jgi:hypothetical protein
MTIIPDRQTDFAPKRAVPWDGIGVGALCMSFVFGVLTIALSLTLH